MSDTGPTPTLPEQPTGPEVPGPRVVDTGDVDDQLKCPSCGATDIALHISTGKLRCNFCRHEWLPESADDVIDLNGDIGTLEGVVIGSGSADIQASADIVQTFKCSSCGAEVVIDTAHALQARCHWCRNTLSANQQIPNGAVPDVVLPFSITKDDAVAKIEAFVAKRRFYAHPRFKAEFNAENVMGVYLPYMIIDVNAHALLAGQGEHETRRYTVGSGDSSETRYDADRYGVTREFDVHINDLTVESSSIRLNRGLHNTNNVINAVMPFDTENALRYDANFLSGFTSERRDTNMEDLTPKVTTESKDIAKFAANDTLGFYDRGVRWDRQDLTVKGQRWAAAYLPVWLYSYLEEKSNGKSLLHYVAVNGRTGNTMGSVPLNQRRLLGVSAVVEVIGIIIAIVLLIVLGA